ncbi:hypothetical protein [Rubinisphaera sp.]|uniref:hypothetical protein n=1 Tax=Rubinisphaera sp. TaxID=2024857 RepID=UPI000C0EA1CC|nr:hypothetical protein [Rubinisphaera sp.]MBV12395.1 hypothetical protein [Rubinisphaera sp.]HCS50106.1 hypothetical protein [Planctomycetaceae bacterium]|tara:strand:- start:5837 stop:6487 length:651 start_codon:yes stop_codon:yes gene_type:complete
MPESNEKSDWENAALYMNRWARNNKANIFRDNLRRLAIKMECPDENSLAKRLCWIREKKKWLRRLWNDGLQRPNAKTVDDLTKLARFFGFSDFGPLWENDVKLPISPRGITEVLTLLRTWDFNIADDFVRHLDHRFPDHLKTNREILQERLINETPEELAHSLFNQFTGQEPPTPEQTTVIAQDIDRIFNDISDQLQTLLDHHRRMLLARLYSIEK